jgi:hypothetical protein
VGALTIGPYAATVGQTFTVSFWANSPIGWANLAPGIEWLTSGGGLIGSSFPGPTVIPANTWTFLTMSAVAPATTGLLQGRIRMGATPANTDLMYIDEAVLTTLVNVSVSSGTVIIPSYGIGWLKDPVRPANNLPLDMRRSTMTNQTLAGQGQGVAYLGLGDQQEKAISALLNINNSPYPVVVSRLREAAVSSLRMMARSTPDVITLKTLTAPGSPLLLQLPQAYQEDDRYLVAGDVTRSPVFNDQRKARRLFSLPFATVLSPVGPMQGVTGVRWNDLCAHTASWGALYAAGGGTYDGFSRTVAPGSWGAPDVPATSASTWTVAGTVADMSVSAGVGMIALSVVNTPDRAFTGSVADSEQYVTAIAPVVATGAGYQVAALARHVDASNYYRLGIEFGLAGATLIFVTKRVAAVETVVASVAGPTYAAGQTWRIHASVVGTALKVSGWKDGTPEPPTFSVSTTDAALAAAAPYGVYAIAKTGNTNVLPVTIQTEDFMAKGSITWQNILAGALS